MRKTLLRLAGAGLSGRGRRSSFPTNNFIATSASTDVKAGGSRTALAAGRCRSWTTRIPISTWTCRSASPATAACASATKCRANSSGRSWNRGDETRIVPMHGTTLARRAPASSCGACVDTCPTGALEDQSVARPRRADEMDADHCSYCGIGLRDERRHARRPDHAGQARRSMRPSKGHLCVKGRYAFDFTPRRRPRHRSR